MGYKKFIVKTLISFVILFSTIYYITLNHKMLYMNPEYPMWIDVKNKINKTKDSHIKLLYLGDSRAKAGFINNEFKECGNSLLNLTIGGATPIEGYYSLKSILDNNNSIDNIVTSYAPAHFLNYETFLNRTVKFNFIDKSIYDEIVLNSIKLYDNKTIDNILNFKEYIFSPSTYMADFINGIFTLKPRYFKNIKMQKELQESNGHHYFGIASGASGLNKEAKAENFQLSPLIDFYFRKLINLANKNNIKIYWYNMPINETSFKNLKNNYANKFHEYINQFASNDFIILNKLYYMNNKYFGDPSHLYLGAKDVTEDMIKKLSTYNICK